jgi:DNA-directed RNA polymerase subunit L
MYLKLESYWDSKNALEDKIADAYQRLDDIKTSFDSDIKEAYNALEDLERAYNRFIDDLESYDKFEEEN